MSGTTAIHTGSPALMGVLASEGGRLGAAPLTGAGASQVDVSRFYNGLAPHGDRVEMRNCPLLAGEQQ